MLRTCVQNSRITLLSGAPQRNFARKASAASVKKSKQDKQLMEQRRLTQRTNTLRKHFEVNERVSFSKMMLAMKADELRERRRHLRKEYGFTEAEQRFIGR